MELASYGLARNGKGQLPYNSLEWKKAFKAFLDRAQTWFILPQEQKPAKNLRVKVILIGAREQGEKLFEGAQLSIKYAMQSIGAQVENTLCLYGLDKPGDLAKNLQKQRQILDFIC